MNVMADGGRGGGNFYTSIPFLHTHTHLQRHEDKEKGRSEEEEEEEGKRES